MPEVALIPLFQFHPNGKLVLGMFEPLARVPKEKKKPLPGLTIELCPMLDCKLDA